jgi:transposase
MDRPEISNDHWQASIGMSRYDLTDFEWRAIEPLLPNKPRGVPRVDDRRVQITVSADHAAGLRPRSIQAQASF